MLMFRRPPARDLGRVAITPLQPTAGARARAQLVGRSLRVAALAAVLAAAPGLARNASAQRTGAIQATAYVVPSYLGAGLRADSAGPAVRANQRPVARQVTIEGVGVVEVMTGNDGQVPVTSLVVDRRGRRTVAVLISFVGT
jgi:hypothetical protein